MMDGALRCHDTYLSSCNPTDRMWMVVEYQNETSQPSQRATWMYNMTTHKIQEKLQTNNDASHNDGTVGSQHNGM